MATHVQMRAQGFFSTPSPSDSLLFQRFFRLQQRHLYTFCAWMTNDEAEAASLTTAIWLQFLSAPPPGSACMEELDTLHEGLAKLLARYYRPSFQLEEFSGTAAPDLYSSDTLSEEDRVKAALQRLPAATRLVYLFYALEGVFPDRLAGWLQIDGQRLAHRLHQARLQLRAVLCAA